MSDTDKPAPEFERAPELFVEKPAEKVTLTEGAIRPPGGAQTAPVQPAPTVRALATVVTPSAAARQAPITTPPPSVPRREAPKSLDPVDQAKAEREAKRQETIAAAVARAAELDAIREAGRLERERDLAADEKAAAEAAEADEVERIEAERQAAADAASLKATVDRLLAERAVRVDREFAESEAKRLEAEKDTDPSLGPQVTLDPRGPLARAARGGAARHMRGNIEVLATAMAAEVEKAA